MARPLFVAAAGFVDTGWMRITIHGYELPGRDCPAGPGFPGYTEVSVALQRTDGELLDVQSAGADEVRWTFECTAAGLLGETLDARGPYIQGGPGRRFIYLSWSGRAADGSVGMFRRAKLWLDGADRATAEGAVASGRLIARLPLTDAKGQPVCATVRPPRITWSAG